MSSTFSLSVFLATSRCPFKPFRIANAPCNRMCSVLDDGAADSSMTVAIAFDRSCRAAERIELAIACRITDEPDEVTWRIGDNESTAAFTFNTFRIKLMEGSAMVVATPEARAAPVVQRDCGLPRGVVAGADPVAEPATEPTDFDIPVERPP